MTSAPAPASCGREPELPGQAVVVIGGSTGIGLETAGRARAEDADVIVTSRNPGRLEQPASELGMLGTPGWAATTCQPQAGTGLLCAARTGYWPQPRVYGDMDAPVNPS